ncbi:Endonuclease/exonuclease/phosphatase, partial [Mycena haematopus]
MVDEHRLGILALQETHLDNTAAAEFDTVFNPWFRLMNSAHPMNPTSTAGVAFLLNKKFVDVNHVQMSELEPGRALMISVPWHGGRTLNILNIYAPNTAPDRDSLWSRLRTKWRDDPSLPLPEIVLGDWNFVEDPRDRLSGGNTLVPASFYILKSLLQIEDGWRNTFKDDRQYTCVQRRSDPSTGRLHVSRSRLDRIYIHHKLSDECRGWRIDQTALKTDHSLVETQLVYREHQELGKGRPNLPLYLLKTRKFTNVIQRFGRIMEAKQKELGHSPRRDDYNIQTLWAQFK